MADRCREAFEAWCTLGRSKWLGDRYKDGFIQSHWVTWQAAWNADKWNYNMESVKSLSLRVRLLVSLRNRTFGTGSYHNGWRVMLLTCPNFPLPMRPWSNLKSSGSPKGGVFILIALVLNQVRF